MSEFPALHSSPAKSPIMLYLPTVIPLTVKQQLIIFRGTVTEEEVPILQEGSFVFCCIFIKQNIHFIKNIFFYVDPFFTYIDPYYFV